LKQQGVDLAAREPRIQKEQHEREDRDARPGERIRAIDVVYSRCNIVSHGMSPRQRSLSVIFTVIADDRGGYVGCGDEPADLVFRKAWQVSSS
jgi:hypothetical protein